MASGPQVKHLDCLHSESFFFVYDDRDIIQFKFIISITVRKYTQYIMYSRATIYMLTFFNLTIKMFLDIKYMIKINKKSLSTLTKRLQKNMNLCTKIG
jgi:hypothetical protein